MSRVVQVNLYNPIYNALKVFDFCVFARLLSGYVPPLISKNKHKICAYLRKILIPENPLKYLIILEIPLKFLKILWNPLKFHEIPWNPLKSL